MPAVLPLARAAYLNPLISPTEARLPELRYQREGYRPGLPGSGLLSGSVQVLCV